VVQSQIKVSNTVESIARETSHTHAAAVEATLADLVAFRTVAKAGTVNHTQPAFKDMTAYLRKKAHTLGLDFRDDGAVVVVGLGDSPERLGIITHGDVQPAHPESWAGDPFLLDVHSEPGRLVARGTEDDKGAIAGALYAMKALKDAGIPLKRRVELIISYTEESNWDAFMAWLKEHEPPQWNVGIDAEYPVVVAEKGFGIVTVGFAADPADPASTKAPVLTTFTGGAFLTQVPEEASAVIAQPSSSLIQQLKTESARYPQVEFTFTQTDGSLRVMAKGRPAHSSTPEDGINALTYLAELLSVQDWPPSRAATMVRFIHDRVGPGYLAERFGEAPFTDDFMGPLTLSLGTVALEGNQLVARMNFRIPAGKPIPTLKTQVKKALVTWSQAHQTPFSQQQVLLFEPHNQRDAPQVDTLLAIFSTFTGTVDPKARSVGGSTHARLLPHGVNFGPAMPSAVYTGHTEHEFLLRDQLKLNLEMATAMLLMLAGGL